MLLSTLSVLFAFLSAALWFYSTSSISVEKEYQRREKLAEPGTSPSKVTVALIDNGKEYDLIATLIHQAKWNKWAAFATALAIVLQALASVI
ncbi:hypothetical protein [Cognatishimia activa]|uniref:hypothetical protein n=1 Tax=Cognatishimia activa TaxID=1715691 RepID=UPI0022300E68|nr:hypothetical protein [Cognatishimia activa]UZD92277.1 hypothetical protein M0D42_06620 [Cognatishimia activa]